MPFFIDKMSINFNTLIICIKLDKICDNSKRSSGSVALCDRFIDFLAACFTN